MTMVDIILKKRGGKELSDEEIGFFITGYTEGSIPDYQVSALLMAICLRGMTDQETVALTKAMAESGETLDLSCFHGLSADKHSTGGVGDKTTLIVAPIVAACGGKVAKMSGRGLGHTGGTVDKLEAIPGYRTTLPAEEFLENTETTGISVIGQTKNLAPADKKLYALRDVTGTVESIPLITSSIMCKKLASGAKTIVLDVKVGSGAFMKTLESAEELARKMVDIGRAADRNMAALITDMNTPLGYAVGNALEVIEAVKVLRGEVKGDIREVALALAGTMVSQVFSLPEEEGLIRAAEALDSGRAYEKMLDWIRGQGGDTAYLTGEKTFSLPTAHTVFSSESGYITAMDTLAIGNVALLLGAGREKKDDAIDMTAGIVLLKKTGDRVAKGEPLALLYTHKDGTLSAAENLFLSALTFGEKAQKMKSIIYKIVK